MSGARHTRPVSIWYSDGAHAPSLAPRDAARLAGVDDTTELDITLGLFLERHPWFDDPDLHARSLMVGYGLAAAASAGRVKSVPTRLSAIPSMIRSNPPDVAVIGAVRRGDSLVYPGTVGWTDVLAAAGTKVVVEVDETGYDFGTEPVTGNIVAVVSRPTPPALLTARPADDVDRTIGRLVASLVPDGATLQFGPGGFGEGIADAVTKPVRLWSGLITDPMAILHERGLLVDQAVGAYVWGGAAIERLHAAGRLRLVSCTVTHDISALSATQRFVACNTAIQVGLDGAVNLERVKGRTISSIGGHADFCTGASRSVGGLSIVAVRSTTAQGAPTIVPAIEVVSTARSDVQVIVTEHGIADLRMLSDVERARAIAEVAAPQHRAELLARA